ncbi:hypothetical protein K458DRAFT_483462 [Lentithecium fluviatile CBS 122367]|uniref:Uncharacterized protein n=1 Tax=Lentithecium fluviatile CBS 122367 TaxID=1168545 RepID=A0A6G1JIG3_9PLEO|nr:hypothetical protein K458DRAFT_483462 [Lentithecium fluviatile CBS 122367]
MTKPSITLNTFRHHSSKILLHELSHTNPYATTDHNGHYNWYQNNGGPTTQDLSAEQLATHADVRAILGQLAVISDRGFTLHRKPRDDANDKQKDDYKKDMKEGRLQKYDNISRRGVQGRITRHARNYASA